MREKKQASFEYTYSAKRQQEIERIRRKYAPAQETEDKMEQLRRLDRQTTRKAELVSLSAGILGALTFGGGLSCVLVFTELLLPGILLGLLGMAGIFAAYPLYTRSVKREREKVAPQILRLVEELKDHTP